MTAPQRLRERNVCRVMGRQVVTEFPYPIEHRERPVARDPQPTKDTEDLPADVFVQVAPANMSSHCVGDLGIDQMRNVNVLLRWNGYLAQAQEPRQNHGCVSDDHRADRD
jgi:hypothetical protein